MKSICLKHTKPLAFRSNNIFCNFMCYQVHNIKTGETAESPAELASMLGCSTDQLIVSEGYGGIKIDAECCLCHIDLLATLREHGWRCDNSCDPMEVDAWPPDIANAEPIHGEKYA